MSVYVGHCGRTDVVTHHFQLGVTSLDDLKGLYLSGSRAVSLHRLLQSARKFWEELQLPTDREKGERPHRYHFIDSFRRRPGFKSYQSNTQNKMSSLSPQDCLPFANINQ